MPRWSKPTIPEVQWNDSMSRALRQYFVVDEEGGAQLKDLAYPPATTVENASGWSWTNETGIPAIRGDTTENYHLSFPNVAYVDQGGGIAATKMALVRPKVDTGGQIAYDCFPIVSPSWDLNLSIAHDNWNGWTGTVTTSGGNNSVNQGNLNLSTADAWTLVIGTYESGTGFTLYVGREMDSTITNVGTDNTNSGTILAKTARATRFWVQGDQQGAVDFGLFCSMGRHISPAEAQDLFEDPFIAVRPTFYPIGFVASAPPAGGIEVLRRRREAA